MYETYVEPVDHHVLSDSNMHVCAVIMKVKNPQPKPAKSLKGLLLLALISDEGLAGAVWDEANYVWIPGGETIR